MKYWEKQIKSLGKDKDGQYGYFINNEPLSHWLHRLIKAELEDCEKRIRKETVEACRKAIKKLEYEPTGSNTASYNLGLQHALDALKTIKEDDKG